MKYRLLCITPIEHIEGLRHKIERQYDLTYMPDLGPEEMYQHSDADIIFTNPNKSKVYLGQPALGCFDNLKVIVTASTGTVHIDKGYCASKGIAVLSLTREFATLEKISSTAEHALCLTLAALRNLPTALESVRAENWDYLPFVGRQINQLTIGVLGFGRLGKMYARYCASLGANVLVCDPWKEGEAKELKYDTTDIRSMFERSDVISLHIHAEGNHSLIDKQLLDLASTNLIIVNTSRGEVINSSHLIDFMEENKNAKYYTDVLDKEYNGLSKNALYSFSKCNRNVAITPHIGGMTSDAQFLAYNRAVNMLIDWHGQNLT